MRTFLKAISIAATITFVSIVDTAAFADPQPAPPPPTTTPPATTAPQGDATTHFQRALELYQEQDFAGALVEFRRAYDLAPTYKLFYNIGQVCYQLTDYACALRNFESYVKEGGGSISTERRLEVERELSKLRLRVGHLEIVSTIPGVEIAIDDVVVGKTPLPQSIVVSTGKRRVVGTHEGFAPVSRIVEVAGTDSSRIELVFVNNNGGSNSGVGSEAPGYESRWNTWSWIGIGTTAALAIASGVTGGIALNASNDLDKKTFADGRGPTDEMKSLKTRTQTFSVVSDVTMGLAGAALIGTLVYTFTHNPRRVESAAPPAEQPPPPTAKQKVDVAFDFTGTGAALTGKF